MEHRKELLRHVEPGEQVGIRLAHHTLSEATQSSLSAFHNAGLGGGVATRASPSLQQIMDGEIHQSNTSMIVRTTGKIESAVSRRTLRYYVDDITNSITHPSLDGSDFWYAIGERLGAIPTRKRDKREPMTTIFRFHISYRRLIDDHITLKHLVDGIFEGYTAYHSPDFVSVIDVYLDNDAQISGIMELLERSIGMNGIGGCRLDNGTFTTVGSNLGEMLNIHNVDNAETVSNHIYDVERNLGIDAAREMLYDEILAKVGNVHTAALMADFMTCKGYVAPFKKDNPMLVARGFLSSIAFERPKGDIKNVIRNRTVDNTESVYSQIMTGQLPSAGTGSRLFSLETHDGPEELDWCE